MEDVYEIQAISKDDRKSLLKEVQKEITGFKRREKYREIKEENGGKIPDHIKIPSMRSSTNTRTIARYYRMGKLVPKDKEVIDELCDDLYLSNDEFAVEYYKRKKERELQVQITMEELLDLRKFILGLTIKDSDVVCMKGGLKVIKIPNNS